MLLNKIVRYFLLLQWEVQEKKYQIASAWQEGYCKSNNESVQLWWAEKHLTPCITLNRDGPQQQEAQGGFTGLYLISRALLLFSLWVSSVCLATSRSRAGSATSDLESCALVYLRCTLLPLINESAHEFSERCAAETHSRADWLAFLLFIFLQGSNIYGWMDGVLFSGW